MSFLLCRRQRSIKIDSVIHALPSWIRTADTEAVPDALREAQVLQAVHHPPSASAWPRIGVRLYKNRTIVQLNLFDVHGRTCTKRVSETKSTIVETITPQATLFIIPTAECDIMGKCKTLRAQTRYPSRRVRNTTVPIPRKGMP